MAAVFYLKRLLFCSILVKNAGGCFIIYPNIDEDDAMKMAERLQKGIFTYNDFLDQIKMIKKMGSIKGLLGMIPGIGKQIKNLEIDDKQFTYIEAIIGSMTPEERKHPVTHRTARRIPSERSI
mgnify:CR=1 FL=1